MEETNRLSENSPGGFTCPEVVEKLAPVISLHSIEVQEDCLTFPGFPPMVGLPESHIAEVDAPAVIRFEDIASIAAFNAHIEVLLTSGELYTFSTTDSIRTHINTYKSGETTDSAKPTTAQDVAGNIWDGLEETLSSGKK